jgi:hypothetical protein
MFNRKALPMSTRRRFVTSIGAALSVTALRECVANATDGTLRSLVPNALSTAPNYWCTWAAQNYLYGQGESQLDVGMLEGSEGAARARARLNEQIILGSQGWSNAFHPRVREELYMLLDDGWEEGGTATFQLDREKFPSFRGQAQERLLGLNNAIRANGWRALALWCRNPAGKESDEQCVGWSKFAGVPYLKIDTGDQSGSMALARAKKDAKIILEHIHHGDGCLNGEWKDNGRFGAQPWGSPRLQILSNTDVYRTYDATAVLGVPTTLDRASELLKGAAGHAEVQSLLNVEDEVYMAASLGCSMGVMRHPMRGLRPNGDADVFFPPPRQLKQRMDEVVRAVRWQRIAPPYAAGLGVVTLDTHALTDEWLFRRGDTFDSDIVGTRVKQGAPARVARNMDLPAVSCDGEPPYVVCARFPGGAAAIGAFERVSVEKRVFQPLADIRWMTGDAPGPFGIFGQFGSLTLVFNRTRRGPLLAQDLAGNAPIDITNSVRFLGSEITLLGALIDRIGKSSATPNDLSKPGLVLVI